MRACVVEQAVRQPQVFIAPLLPAPAQVVILARALMGRCSTPTAHVELPHATLLMGYSATSQITYVKFLPTLHGYQIAVTAMELLPILSHASVAPLSATLQKDFIVISLKTNVKWFRMLHGYPIATTTQPLKTLRLVSVEHLFVTRRSRPDFTALFPRPRVAVLLELTHRMTDVQIAIKVGSLFIVKPLRHHVLFALLEHMLIKRAQKFARIAQEKRLSVIPKTHRSTKIYLTVLTAKLVSTQILVQPFVQSARSESTTRPILKNHVLIVQVDSKVSVLLFAWRAKQVFISQIVGLHTVSHVFQENLGTAVVQHPANYALLECL